MGKGKWMSFKLTRAKKGMVENEEIRAKALLEWSHKEINSLRNRAGMVIT